MESSRCQSNEHDESGHNVLHFTSEDIKRFLRLSLRSTQWVTFKAVAVLAHCGQLKCSQLQYLKWGDMHLSEVGLRIQYPLRDDGSTFLVPFDDHDVLGCQASKLRKYVVACRACRPNNEDDSPLVRTFSLKTHMKSGMSGTDLRDVPRQIAEVLELSYPERYRDRAFLCSKDGHQSDDDSEGDQDDHDLHISTKDYHQRAWREWQRYAKFSGCKNTPVEEDYAKYFRHLKETQGGSVTSILRKYSLLNVIHKRKFLSSLMDWPNLKATILSWKAMDEAKKSKKVKQLTREDVLTFLDMDASQDPEMVLIKAAMALLFHSKVNVGTISRAQSNQIEKLGDGGYMVQVTRPAKYRLREDVSFPIPPGPTSRALDQYLALLEANLGQPIQGQFLKQDMSSSADLQQARLWKFPTIVARRLGFSEPDLYHGGRSFYIEQRKGPSTHGAAIAMEIRNLQQNLDLAAFPIADVEDFGSKIGSRAKSEYKFQWQSFIAFCQSNTPQEDDYIRYYQYLRSNKNIHSATLVNKRSGLNFYHTRIFGTSINSFTRLKDLIGQYRAEDRAKGLLGLKKFTQAELEHFFTHEDYNTPLWILMKAAAAIIMSGKLSPQQLSRLQVGDVMLSQEGYWVSYEPKSDGDRATFLVPFKLATQPALNLAGHVKTYMDSVAKNRQYLDGAFFRRFNHPYGFMEEPLAIWTLRSIGNTVAKALKLEQTLYYRNCAFIVDEPAKMGSVYRYKLDPNRRRRPHKRKRITHLESSSDSD